MSTEIFDIDILHSEIEDRVHDFIQDDLFGVGYWDNYWDDEGAADETLLKFLKDNYEVKCIVEYVGD